MGSCSSECTGSLLIREKDLRGKPIKDPSSDKVLFVVKITMWCDNYHPSGPTNSGQQPGLKGCIPCIEAQPSMGSVSNPEERKKPWPALLREDASPDPWYTPRLGLDTPHTVGRDVNTPSLAGGHITCPQDLECVPKTSRGTRKSP